MLSNAKDFKYDLVWKKGERVSGFLDSNKKPLRNHESILVFYKNQPTFNPQMIEGKALHSKGEAFKLLSHKNSNYGDFNQVPDDRKGNTEKFPKSVLNFERPHPPIHPTQKPVELCEWIIKSFKNEGDLVLDNCSGSGTTGVASRNTKRNFILIEKEKEYCQIAYERLT